MDVSGKQNPHSRMKSEDLPDADQLVESYSALSIWARCRPPL